tara:strand:+ start:210 stop:1817 length:1608 start_codon:yes stop_codon:yes gene_type:complete
MDQYDDEGRTLDPWEIPVQPPELEEEKTDANLKRLAWEGFKWAVPGGSIADVFIDQDIRGNLKITKPKYEQAAHPLLQLAGMKLLSEFNTTVTPYRPLPQKTTSTPTVDYENIIKESDNYSNNRFKQQLDLIGTNPVTQQQIPSYENRPVYIPPEERIGTQKGEPLMSINNIVPRWIFDWKGTQFENTSDYLGENLPGGLNPQQQRNWYSKVTYNRVLNEVLKQGGTKIEAEQIFKEHRANFKPYSQGGRGTVATVTELNRMFNKWEPGIQLRTESYQRNGEEYWRWRFKDVDGKQTRWDFKRKQIEPIIKSYSSTTFAKDHINPVVDPTRIGGGYFGADNEHNLEIIFQFLNTQKSNTFKLPAELLKEMGVPETFSEFINMKLYPQNYSEITVPQYWKEQFQKIVLADYNEATRGIQSPNKKAAIMKKLIYKHSAFFRDPVYSEGLKKLENALGQQMIENMEQGIQNTDIIPELPSWVGLLQKPPGGWKGNDPVWNSFSKDAKQRYEQMYNYRQRTIKLEPYKKPPQSGKIYDN